MSEHELALRVVRMLNKNWVYVDVLFKTYLREVLSKKQQIHIMRLAIDMMERQLDDTV